MNNTEFISEVEGNQGLKLKYPNFDKIFRSFFMNQSPKSYA